MAIILIGVIVLLVSFPARHELLSLWPAAVDEYILAADEGSAERVVLQSSAEQKPPRQAVVAHSRPLSVVALQRVGEEPSFGFLAGYRAGPDELLQADLPEPLSLSRVELPLESDWILVMLAPDDEMLELPAGSLVGFYRPNQLSLAERLGLLMSRVVTGLRAA